MKKNNIKMGSPERFGFEWSKYSDILPIYETQFRRWTPFFKERDWINKYFLDVGCGMGRNSYWPMVYGAQGGWAIDVDEQSLSAARRNLERFLTIEIKQMSAYEINTENKFDIVFSIGVIHHLDDPDKALKNMVKAAKEGGKILIWLYGYENNRWIVWIFNPVRKLLFSNLPIKLLHALSLFPSIGIWLLVKNGIGRIEYFKLMKKFSFSHIRSIVFDQMLPKIVNFYKKEEAIALLEHAGLMDIRIDWVNEMSWAVMGTKPCIGKKKIFNIQFKRSQK